MNRRITASLYTLDESDQKCKPLNRRITVSLYRLDESDQECKPFVSRTQCNMQYISSCVFLSHKFVSLALCADIIVTSHTQCKGNAERRLPQTSAGVTACDHSPHALSDSSLHIDINVSFGKSDASYVSYRTVYTSIGSIIIPLKPFEFTFYARIFTSAYPFALCAVFR